ncbi:MAG: T9SS type A sorting domain-containing protein [Bacteroidetes bacterium]|nr:T9SS type A sorting domain-containing protein [Bacteroidota bacterium]
MKTLTRTIALLALLTCGQTAVAQLNGAKIELFPISGGASEVRFGAKMTPVATVLNIEAVSVAVAYDISLFTADANSVQNKHFAQHSWMDASSPEFQTGTAPGICVYGEYHPNFGSQAVFRGAPATLCEFVLYPKSSNPGTADFTIYANNPTTALTYYFVYQVSGQQNFDPVVNITGMYYPVELSAFTATQQGASVALLWTTQGEDGNFGFHIERRDLTAADGAWTAIGFTEGAGDTKIEQQYLFFDWSLPHDGMYAYRLKQEDFDGRLHFSDEVLVRYSGNPLQFALRQNYPNPVSLSAGSETTIGYDLGERSRVRLTVHNLLGQQVAVIAEHELDAGSYSASWRPSGVPAGMYTVTLAAESAESGRAELRHMRLQVLR